ncbi:hypothetical protein [Paludisphaera soli]|uniref:hypothetical protein n=1 Tax=Paludisphaera soli TaxID=2712865 RepID=UPI0013EC5F90|nr:hypothetical protein [Paludisphaera soli]
MTPEDIAPEAGPYLDEAAVDADEFARREAFEAADRLWIRAIAPLLQPSSPEPDPNPRVQFALDRMRIAACERIARILASDLPEGSA